MRTRMPDKTAALHGRSRREIGRQMCPAGQQSCLRTLWGFGQVYCTTSDQSYQIIIM